MQRSRSKVLNYGITVFKIFIWGAIKRRNTVGNLVLRQRATQSRIPLKAMVGGLRIVALSISCHEQTQ